VDNNQEKGDEGNIKQMKKTAERFQNMPKIFRPKSSKLQVDKDLLHYTEGYEYAYRS
jgi:hypothetical protein